MKPISFPKLTLPDPGSSVAPTLGGLVLAAAGRTGGIGVLSVDSLELTTWQSPLLGRGAAVLSSSGGPTDDTIWVPDDTAPPTDVRYQLLRLDGAVAEDLGSAVVELPDATLLGSDGRGALVVERRRDVFVVGVDGAVRLTSGELIAIGETTASVRECESVVDCAVTRIDRTSDTPTPVSTRTALLDGLGAVDAYRGAALCTTVSPDGDVLVWNADSTFSALLVGPPVTRCFVLEPHTN